MWISPQLKNKKWDPIQWVGRRESESALCKKGHGFMSWGAADRKGQWVLSQWWESGTCEGKVAERHFKNRNVEYSVLICHLHFLKPISWLYTKCLCEQECVCMCVNPSRVTWGLTGTNKSSTYASQVIQKPQKKQTSEPEMTDENVSHCFPLESLGMSEGLWDYPQMRMWLNQGPWL